MAWSTKQLADLANTTVSTVRHYHKVGLLDLPERGTNGYKHYDVSHLVRLLQIMRLSDLGIPLSRISEWDRTDSDFEDEIDRLDAEMAAAMDRMARVREELAAVKRHRSPADLPAGFAPLARELSDAQRAVLTVFSAVLSPADLDQLRQAMSTPDPATDAFESLPEDADDAAVERVAQQLVHSARETRNVHPALLDLTARSPHGEPAAQFALAHAVAQFYNPAQIRALQRLDALLAPKDPTD